MFYCNSCDVRLCSNSRNRHLLTKGHLINAEKIPFETGLVVTIDAYEENEKNCVSSVLEKIEIINSCNICKVRDDGTNFYEKYITHCKKCKNTKNKEKIEKKRSIN